jgi:endonuclease/exonuclease/phosphatase family metal-dependent hydrolase
MALPPGYTFPERDTLRVATWNVENFVDRHDDPYVDAERENDPGEAMAGRVERFARAVRAMNADVVVVQEMESEAFLQQIVEERLPESGYAFFASTESPTWFQNVVVMSRYPLGVLRSYADVVTPLVGQTTDDGEPAATALINHRLWMVDVRTSAGPSARALTLVGAHLKAGSSARDRAWRTGQIRFLHTELTRLLARRPDADILVAGDLNATADSPELRLLLNDPARPAPDSLRGNVPGVFTARFTDPLHGTDTFTYPSDAPSRQLDYLLPNRPLRSGLVDGSMRVASPLPDSQMAATSDHLPVVATFRITALAGGE